MANIIFNVALGRIAEMAFNSDVMKLMLLKAPAEADSIMRDYATVAEILVESSEANFDGYSRKIVTGITVEFNDTDDKVYVKAADPIVYNGAGAVTPNTILKAVLYRDSGADVANEPLICFDASFTTNGNNVTINFPAGGFFESQSAA